jgi:hypothetical protein
MEAIYDFLSWPVTEHVQRGIIAHTLPNADQVDEKALRDYWSTIRDFRSFDPNHWRQDLSLHQVKAVEATPFCSDLMKIFEYPSAFA